MDMNLQKYLSFVKTVECGSFTKAAEMINYTQSGISRMIADLKGLQSGLIRIGTISSVAPHWLPNILKEFQKDYPNIDYELLLGDYTEIEDWIQTGKVDCGFLILPTRPEIETIFLMKDRLMAVIPELILKRIPYRIRAKELDIPAYRNIAFALKNYKIASLAVKQFMKYLHYRQSNTKSDSQIQ